MRDKTRFTVWGAVTGLACVMFLVPGALVFVPALQEDLGAVVAGILAAGAIGAILGFSLALMKNGSEDS